MEFREIPWNSIKRSDCSIKLSQIYLYNKFVTKLRRTIYTLSTLISIFYFLKSVVCTFSVSRTLRTVLLSGASQTLEKNNGEPLTRSNILQYIFQLAINFYHNSSHEHCCFFIVSLNWITKALNDLVIMWGALSKWNYHCYLLVYYYAIRGLVKPKIDRAQRPKVFIWSNSGTQNC